MKQYFPFYLLFILVFLSCSPGHFAPVQLNAYNYNMDGSKQGEQNAMKEMLKPYSDSVNHSMNMVLGTLEEPLSKSWPGCSLGCFMTDAYMEGATKKFGRKVDVAAMNYGGIRLLSMEPGPISKGKLFELMPFDNLMVLLEIDGVKLQAFFDHIAGRSGWPVSGASYTIENKKAVKVMVGGKPIDPSAMYTLATSDYVAGGGDESNVLKGVPQLNIGYLQRDALIDYVMEHKIIRKPQGERVIRSGD